MSKLTIIPDILEQNIDKVKEKIPTVIEFTNQVHIDIMDGIMVDNITIDLGQLFELNLLEKLKIDVHLMVEYPIEYLGDCHQIHAYRAFAQIEKMHSQFEFVEKAKDLNVKPCLALDLYTPVESIEKELYSDLDGILIMSVKAGWSGQEFSDTSIQKVKDLRKLGYQGHILMDGGMTDKTICPCLEAGADEFAVNSYFWNAEDKKAILEMGC